MCMMSMVEQGDAVLVPDPYYATYEGVVRATGAEFVPVSMSADNGFRLTVDQLERAMVPHARVLLLNSPHNPTGLVLSRDEVEAIGNFCLENDLWILSDEVYEDLIFSKRFASPFDQAAFADITVAASSISKSHAAPGFRSGWAVGPAWFIDRVQAVAESFLFGNQPFIADMTVHALTHQDDTAQTMTEAYQRRIDLLVTAFDKCEALKPLKPEAGMFMLLDVSDSGLDGGAFAKKLLDFGVGVMPGNSFGAEADSFIRLSLTVADEKLAEAAKRIINCANAVSQGER